MKLSNLDNMFKGWFIGDFEPSLNSTSNVEVAVKKYKKGDYEKKHYHKLSTEYTVIISGLAELNNERFSEGTIIEISPNESADFKALQDTITVVVKIPGTKNDKYFE